jgi:hypothetical protein
MRYHVTRSIAGLAIAAIPTLALAQAAAQPNPAADHLTAARAALNRVLNAPVPAGDTFKNVSDIKTEYLLLERAASTASPEWHKHYATIDRLIGEVLGAASSSGEASSSKEAGAVGTSGRAGSPAGRLDAGVAANLQEFRKHLMAFSSAMSPVAPSPSAAAASPTAPPETAPAAPPATATPPVTAPSAPPDEAPPATVPSSSAAGAATPDAETDATAQLDQVSALVDRALGASPGETIPVDRATLEQIKTQLERIKQRMQKP